MRVYLTVLCSIFIVQACVNLSKSFFDKEDIIAAIVVATIGIVGICFVWNI